MDKLREMMKAQRDLMDLYYGSTRWREMSRRFRRGRGGWEGTITAELKDAVLALADEQHEMLRELNWKPWKKTQKTVDRQRVCEELIDALHFLLQQMALLDMTSDQIFVEYMKKKRINQARQAGGY